MLIHSLANHISCYKKPLLTNMFQSQTLLQPIILFVEKIHVDQFTSQSYKLFVGQSDSFLQYGKPLSGDFISQSYYLIWLNVSWTNHIICHKKIHVDQSNSVLIMLMNGTTFWIIDWPSVPIITTCWPITQCLLSCFWMENTWLAVSNNTHYMLTNHIKSCISHLFK